MKSTLIEVSSHRDEKFCLHNFIEAAVFLFICLLKIGQKQTDYINRKKLNGANESFLKITDNVKESQLD